MKLLSEIDKLSGLYRREAIVSKLEDLLACGYPNSPVLIILEIHRFKNVNDGIGPKVGDKLIKQYAARIVKAAPNDAIIGRIDGDGFAIILNTTEQLDSICHQLIDMTSRPYSILGNVLVVYSTLGIAIGNKDATSAHELIRAADIALHTSESGKNEILYFEQEMLLNAESMHLLENDLRYSLAMEKTDLLKAIASEQFEIYYQPQTCTKTKRTIGLEALLRWHHPTRGFVSPEDFIPLAEEIGVINLLGAWVLKKACKDFQLLSSSTKTDNLTLSVNVSPKQLENMDAFIAQLKQALAESQINPTQLILEITENTALQANETEIMRISSLGCQLALDDFGTGYSSLTVLRNLPLHSAKLDKLFICDLFLESNNDDKRDIQMITAFQKMCESMNIATVVEGVETQIQAEYIAKLGCDYIQGFYYSQPLPLEKLIDYLKKEYRE